ncbi:MAG: hypothetical protein K2Z81_09950, partial [Cyanobacteria bacterium]|nr:hypothetical protein [Cyanobacteriota bacterium]
RDENGWNNTKCTSTVFLALLEKELAERPDRTTNFNVDITSGSKTLTKLLFDQPIEDKERITTIGLNPVPETVFLKKNGKGWLYFNSLLQYDRPLRPTDELIAKSSPRDLRIKREFFRLIPYNQNKKQMSVAETRTQSPSFYVRQPLEKSIVQAGEVLEMRVEVDAPISIPYVMLEAGLPSGGEVVSEYRTVLDPEELKPNFDPSGNTASWWWWTHKDILDDRIVFFSSIMDPGKKSFQTLIRMEMPGEFGINPATLQSMYSKHVRGYSTVGRITVR